MTTFATIVTTRFDIFDMLIWCSVALLIGMWLNHKLADRRLDYQRNSLNKYADTLQRKEQVLAQWQRTSVGHFVPREPKQ